MRTSTRPARDPVHVAVRAALAAGCLAAGSAAAVPDTVPLDTLAGTRSMRLDGSAQEKAGASVAHAGDINGDGFDDLVVGAPDAAVETTGYYGGTYSTLRAGRAYVVFGRANPPAALPLSAVGGGAPGVRLEGTTENGFFGRRVAPLGDINGDGRDDIAVVGPRSAISVVLGASSFPPVLNTGQLSGPNGFGITGLTATGSNAPGYVVSSAGDLNGDGLDDIAIGDFYAVPATYPNAPAGRAWVVFGRTTFPAVVDLSSLPPSQAIRFEGRPGDRAGYALATLGDVNGDSLDDLAIGTSPYISYASANARVYVVFGRPGASPFAATTALDTLGGTAGFAFQDAVATNFNLVSVAGAGDVNGDGRRDLLAGMAHASRAHVVFGAASFPALVSTASLDGVVGVTLTGESFAGAMVAGTNDHNGDGIADMLVTAPNAPVGGTLQAGRAYVAYGRASFGAATVPLTGISHPLGFRLDGSVAGLDFLKPAIATAAPRQRNAARRPRRGDIDGDGAADLVLGELRAASNAGRAYVVFASPEVSAVPAPPAPASPITFSDFPFDPIGPTATISLANTGGATMQLSQPAPVAAPFAASFATGAATQVPPQQSRTLTVGCLIGDEQVVTQSTMFAATIQLATNDPDEPALSYPLRCDPLVTDFDSSPPAGQMITLSGASGATLSANLVVRGFGPSALNVHACVSDSPSFTLSPGLFPLTTPINQDAIVPISCVAPAVGTTLSANLTCTDINDPDERGASYALRCSGVAGASAQFASTPPAGATITISGAPSVASATRVVRVSNAGQPGSTLAVTSCAFSDNRFSVMPPSLSIAQGAAPGDLTIGCQLPPGAGTTFTDNLLCNTNDPVRATVAFTVACTRPASGISLPQDPLVDPGSLAGENFGRGVAIADADVAAQVFVVGAPRPLLGSGEVHVFVRTPADDTPAAKARGGLVPLGKGSAPTAVLRMNGGNIGDKFGQSVAVSRDGSTIVVGAPGRDVGGTDRGAAFVFRRPPGGWVDATTIDPTATLLQPIAGSGATPGAFGEALAIGEDGRIAVGAPDSDRSGVTDAGLAYVFAPQAGTWMQEHEVQPPQPEDGAGFGTAVAMASGLLAIGAPGEDDGASAEEGALYTWAANGPALGPTVRTVRLEGGIGDKFGASVAITDRMVVVGASEDDTASGAGSGSATIFLRGPGAAVVETTSLEPPIGAFQRAGSSVSTNGNLVVLGAPLADGIAVRAGRAYVFDLPSVLPPRLTPTSALENPGGATDDAYAGAVVVGKRHLLVGVPLDEPLDAQPNADDGRADPYLLDTIFRNGGE